VSLWRDVVRQRVGAVHNPRDDKRMPLSEAIRRFVRPGMRLNPANLQPMPAAANYELCRQFAGRDPQFEFIASSLAGMYLPLVHLGLIRRAIVSFAGDGYPTPGPTAVVARALAGGRFELENWSMLTIVQRLLAGAMGVPFLPTRSLAGSSLGEENAARGRFAEIDDPFEPGRRQGVVQAYQPDLSLVYAWAADPAGNALMFPPHQDNVYGPLAAREGVIVTAHRIVSTDFIRRYAHLVRIPAERVVAVCETPYGCHPYGNYARGIAELESHTNDYAFLRSHRAAQDDPARYDAWVREWILDPADHEAYLHKLGRARLARLHALARPESWREELEEHAAELDQPRPASSVEQMIALGARAVAQRIRERGYRTLLSGVGQATLMAWLAADRLRDEGIEVAMMAETGMYGQDPRPADPFLINFRNLPTTTVLTDIFEILGLHGGGATNRCLATIGAGEVDRFGNVNSSLGRDGRFLAGSGGANDIASAAQELVVVAAQRAETFVEKVAYVTSPGERVDCLISTLGRFEKRGGDELILTGYLDLGQPAAHAVAEIRERCGWPLRVASQLEALAPASDAELALLRVYDPERLFLGKASSGKAGARAPGRAR
jgi:acyl CoA:acetate/3-ketoacid CoA transferase alpha subunit/acyl CoA:acetate/3-ketoacid CoA transferase beta subunit